MQRTNLQFAIAADCFVLWENNVHKIVTTVYELNCKEWLISYKGFCKHENCMKEDSIHELSLIPMVCLAIVETGSELYDILLNYAEVYKQIIDIYRFIIV